MDENEALTFILSDETRENSYGFKVLTKGIDLGDFKNNPVLLYIHGSWDAVGRWENIRKENDQVLAEAVFDEEDEFSARIAGKVKRGFIKGASIGLDPVEWEEKENEDGSKYLVLKKSVAIEGSVCPLPSNRNALRLYDSNRELLTPDQVQLTLQKVTGPPTPPQNQNPETMAKIELSDSVLKKLELSDDATTEQVEAKVKILLSRLEQADQAEKAAKEARAVKLADGLVEAGKCKAGEEREDWYKFALSDYDLAEKQAAKLTAVSKPASHTEKGDTNRSGKDSEGKSFDELRKENPVELSRIREEEPGRYKELLKKSKYAKNI